MTRQVVATRSAQFLNLPTNKEIADTFERVPLTENIMPKIASDILIIMSCILKNYIYNTTISLDAVDDRLQSNLLTITSSRR